MDDLDNAISAYDQQQARANLVATSGTPPQQARDAIAYGPQVGLPPSSTMDDPSQARDMVAQQKRETILTNSPYTAQYVGSDPARAAASADDLENLANVEDTFKKHPGFIRDNGYYGLVQKYGAPIQTQDQFSASFKGGLFKGIGGLINMLDTPGNLLFGHDTSAWSPQALAETLIRRGEEYEAAGQPGQGLVGKAEQVAGGFAGGLIPGIISWEGKIPAALLEGVNAADQNARDHGRQLNLGEAGTDVAASVAARYFGGKLLDNPALGRLKKGLLNATLMGGSELVQSEAGKAANGESLSLDPKEAKEFAVNGLVNFAIGALAHGHVEVPEAPKPTGEPVADPGTAQVDEKSGMYSFDKDGHVLGENGAPIHFATAQEAAAWMDQAKNDANGQWETFDVVPHPTGKEYSQEEALTELNAAKEYYSKYGDDYEVKGLEKEIAGVEDGSLDPTATVTQYVGKGYSVKADLSPVNPEELLNQPIGHNDVSDAQHIMQAIENAESLQDLSEAVNGTKTGQAEGLSDYLRGLTGGSSAFIDPKALQDLYLNERKDPAPGDGLLGDVPGLLEAWRSFPERKVEVALHDLAAHGKGKSWFQDLIPHISTSPEGMTLHEAMMHAEMYKAGEVPIGSMTFDQAQATDTDGKLKLDDEDGYEHYIVQKNKVAMEAAVMKATKALYLNDLFKNGKAIGITQDMLKRYSAKVEGMQRAMYAKMLDKVRKQIKRERTAEWKKVWQENYAKHFDSIAQSQAAVALHALRDASSGKAGELAQGHPLHGTKLRDAAGNIISFFRGQGKPLAEGQWFKGSYGAATKDKEGNLLKAAKHGVSFTPMQEFATNWSHSDPNFPPVGSKNTPVHPDKPLVYKVKVHSEHPADFENPEHVRRFAKAIKEHGGLGQFDSMEDLEHALKGGNWRYWEQPHIMEAAGFDSVRMKESPNSPSKNLFVPNDLAHNIYLEYDLPIANEVMKLDPASLKAYPKELQAVVSKEMRSEGGLTPDEAAAKLGYTSGEEMLRDIKGLLDARKPRESLASQFQRMATEFAQQDTEGKLGNYLSKDEMEAAAHELVPEPKVTDLLHEKLKVLWHAINGEDGPAMPLTKQQIEEEAERQFNALDTKGALRVKQFARDVHSTGRAVAQALLKNDPVEAFKQQQAQIMAVHGLRHAIDFQNEFRQAMKVVKRFAQNTELDNVPNSWLDQIHGILRSVNVNLRRTDANLAQELEGHPLEKFLISKINDGHDIYTHLGYQRGKDLIEHSVDDFRGVIGMVKSLGVAAKNEGELLTLGKSMKKEDVIKATLESLASRDTTIDKEQIEHPNWAQRVQGVGRSMDAWVLRWEQFLLNLVGGKVDHPLNEALNLAFHDRQAWLDDQLVNTAKTFRDLKLGKDWNKWLDTKVDLPYIVDHNGDRVFSRKRDIVGAALHWGTEDNATKLVEGYRTHNPDITPEVMQSILDEHMTAEGWTFAKAVWDWHEGQWPEILKQYRARGGQVPTKVPGRSFETKHGTIEGGYYPIRYDRSDPGYPVNFEFEDFAGTKGYGRALPANGYVHERTKVTAPLDINLGLTRLHMDRVLHDLAFRDLVMDMHKTILDKRVINAITRKYGPEYAGEGGARLKQWVDDIASFRSVDMRDCTVLHKLLNGLNRNALINLVGYSLKTVAKHMPTALSNSVAEVGPVHFGAASAKLLGDFHNQYRFAIENSGELRHRMFNSAEGMRETFLRATEKQPNVPAWNFMQRYAMSFVAASDQASAVPTWLAAVSKLKDQFPEKSDQDIFRLADQTVRQAHGSSNAFDRPDAFRYDHSVKGEVWKAFTRFGTFFNHMYNRVRGIPGTAIGGVKKLAGGDLKGGSKDLSKALAQTVFYIGVGSVIEQLVDGEYDPEKGFIENFANGSGRFMTSMVPMLRDVAYDVMRIHKTGRLDHMEATGPVADAFNSGMDLYGDIHKMDAGDEPQQLPEHALKALGFAFGGPGFALARPAQFLWDLKGTTGNEMNNSLAADAVWSSLMGESQDIKSRYRPVQSHGFIGGGATRNRHYIGEQ